MDTIGKYLEAHTRNPHYIEMRDQTQREILNDPNIKDFINQHKGEVSQEMIQNSLSKLNEYRLEHQAIARGEDGQNPGFKPSLFINGNYIDITYVPTQAYYRSKEAHRQAQLLDNEMMSREVRGARLSEIYLNTPQRQHLILEIEDFVKSYRRQPRETQGLYLSGSYGVGKTYILGALANELVRQDVSVVMLHYPTFANDLRRLVGEGRHNHEIDRVKQTDILIMDDIGAENNTVWLRDDVLNVILEYRMKESLPTFFSSNFTLAELETRLAQTKDGGTEKVKASRLMQRIKYLAKPVELVGEDLRMQTRLARRGQDE